MEPIRTQPTETGTRSTQESEPNGPAKYTDRERNPSPKSPGDGDIPVASAERQIQALRDMGWISPGPQ